MHTLKIAALALLGLVLAGPSQAFTFVDLGTQAGSPAGDLQAVEVLASDAGGSFDVHWGVDDPALSAMATFTVTSFAAGSVVLDITLDHTTDLADSGLTNAAILSMGFGVDPEVVATLSGVGSVFDTVGTGSGPQRTFPGGFKQIDVCIFAAGCSGGSINSGLAAGSSDSFQVTLTPESSDFSDGLTLAFFPIKFQTSAGSFEPPGGFTPPIPEPTSVLLYAAGVMVVGVGGQRRRRAA
ncbi:MAG TPA: cistern family PEP-CTERM protein [Myxococcota bacterium]|nr:cistern family PEP-CTERM protein [Myxococcota bacterium]